MNAKPLLLMVLLTLPAFGQSVYKCPQPDGKISYQRARCAEGGKISIQDNGSGTRPTGTRPTDEPAAAETSLRSGEQQMLENIQQREREDKDRAAEFAKAAAIREHQKAVKNMSEQMHRDHEQKMELMRNRYRVR